MLGSLVLHSQETNQWNPRRRLQEYCRPLRRNSRVRNHCWPHCCVRCERERYTRGEVATDLSRNSWTTSPDAAGESPHCSSCTCLDLLCDGWACSLRREEKQNDERINNTLENFIHSFEGRKSFFLCSTVVQLSTILYASTRHTTRRLTYVRITSIR